MKKRYAKVGRYRVVVHTLPRGRLGVEVRGRRPTPPWFWWNLFEGEVYEGGDMVPTEITHCVPLEDTDDFFDAIKMGHKLAVEEMG